MRLQIKISPRGPSRARGVNCPVVQGRPAIIAATFVYSTPGVLVSSPRHPTTTSTRLKTSKQLIFDLKNSNPSAQHQRQAGLRGRRRHNRRRCGEGTTRIKILISGDGGGTGASPLTSVSNTPACPGSLGIAETHQTLVKNDLRSAGCGLETDGQIRRRAVTLCHRRDAWGPKSSGWQYGPAHHARLHHDAEVSPQHLPSRHRHAGSEELRARSSHGRAGPCRQLPVYGR